MSFARVFRVDLLGISARGYTSSRASTYPSAQPVAGDGDNQRDALHLQHRLPASTCVLEHTSSVGAHVLAPVAVVSAKVNDGKRELLCRIPGNVEKLSHMLDAGAPAGLFLPVTGFRIQRTNALRL
eukprot:5043542-Pyramimonas_sp.AAC.1